MKDALTDRVRNLLGQQVFTFARAAQRQFRTSDLVVLLDLNSPAPALNAVPRQRVLGAIGLSEEIQQKLTKPASDLKSSPGLAEQSFWFVVLFGDARMACCPVNRYAPRMA